MLGTLPKIQETGWHSCRLVSAGLANHSNTEMENLGFSSLHNLGALAVTSFPGVTSGSKASGASSILPYLMPAIPPQKFPSLLPSLFPWKGTAMLFSVPAPHCGKGADGRFSKVGGGALTDG